MFAPILMNFLGNLCNHRTSANTPEYDFQFYIFLFFFNKFGINKMMCVAVNDISLYFSVCKVFHVACKLNIMIGKFTWGLSSGRPNNGLFGTYPISASTATPSSTHDIYILAPPSLFPTVSVIHLFSVQFIIYYSWYLWNHENVQEKYLLDFYVQCEIFSGIYSMKIGRWSKIMWKIKSVRSDEMHRSLYWMKWNLCKWCRCHRFCTGRMYANAT